MKQEMFSRTAELDLSDSPQALYAFSIGSVILAQGEEVFNNGIRNPFIELHWGGAGIGEIIYYGQQFEIRENDVFFWMPGENQFCRAISTEWHYRWLCFDGPLAEAIMLSYRFSRHLQSCGPCPVELFEDIEQNINSSQPQEIGRLAGVVLGILSHLRQSQKFQEPLWARCIAYIKTHYSDPSLCIGTLCDVFDVPRSTLTKLFMDHMQRALGSYIRDIRYENALALIRSSELPFAEIAQRCGYVSYPSFSRLIHRGTGLSPIELRKRKYTTLSSPGEST